MNLDKGEAEMELKGEVEMDEYMDYEASCFENYYGEAPLPEPDCLEEQEGLVADMLFPSGYADDDEGLYDER